jgi:hypothetical protein
MDVPSLLLGIALGLVAGGIAAWLAGRGTTARLEERVAAERRAGEEKLALLAQAESKLRDAFAALSAEALRRNNQSFLDLARTSLGEFQQSASSELEQRQKAVGDLVRPIQEALARVDGKLGEVEKRGEPPLDRRRGPRLRPRLRRALIARRARGGSRPPVMGSPQRHRGLGGFLHREGTLHPDNTSNWVVAPLPDALRARAASVPSVPLW